MKKLLSLLAVSTLIATSASSLKPVFTNSIINFNLILNQITKKNNIKKGNDIAFEKDYRFLAHDWLKLKVDYNTFLSMKATFNSEKISEQKKLSLW